MAQTGVLYVVATPIGNLGDLAPRARQALADANVVAAEDTRHSGRMLREFGLQKPLLSLHEHNERARSGELVARLRAGESVALISDAGTPLVSDPGYHLLHAAIAAGIKVVPLPGPCAAIAALSVAGLPTDRFCFEGFLPARAAPRRLRLGELARETRTIILYEAPHRLAACLADLATACGTARQATIGRELTKLHETIYRGQLGELAARAAQDSDLCRGELVIVIDGAAARAADSDAELDRVLGVLLRHLPASAAAAAAAEIVSVRRNHAYSRALALAAAQRAEGA